MKASAKSLRAKDIDAKLTTSRLKMATSSKFSGCGPHRQPCNHKAQLQQSSCSMVSPHLLIFGSWMMLICLQPSASHLPASTSGLAIIEGTSIQGSIYPLTPTSTTPSSLTSVSRNSLNTMCPQWLTTSSRQLVAKKLPSWVTPKVLLRCSLHSRRTNNTTKIGWISSERWLRFLGLRTYRMTL